MPPLNNFKVQPVDEARLLRWLLAESLRRLRAARQLEQTRKIVYPETTSILRDCERLARRLNALTTNTNTNTTDADELRLLAADL